MVSRLLLIQHVVETLSINLQGNPDINLVLRVKLSAPWGKAELHQRLACRPSVQADDRPTMPALRQAASGGTTVITCRATGFCGYPKLAAMRLYAPAGAAAD